jgi:aminopeptidase N/puromycin-sensitive aminopeptidase
LSSEIAAGAASIHINYLGQLNGKLRGLYRSEANHRKYAVTQFEAIDARVAFPSFDEPAYKATFDISAVIDKDDTAISNGRIVSDDPAPGNKHTIRFSTTPKMSSYLVALTVGDWKCISGEQDGIQLRVCSVPGKEQQGEFALDATKAILHYYDQYFSIKYPYGKLDQIAVPDFEAGAMENTAAIIYRERDLLLDKSKASVDDQKNVALVIAHEMAHQWFGDLVTMKWWNDIWLNEGFASWMETKPVAAWRPEWRISQDQVLSSNEALSTDSARNTRPIRQKAESREEINSLFDGIAYGKTASVLRMLEGYLGPEEFRKGVNSYLQAHAYSNATAEDFWGAMAKASGKPIDQIMPTFVTQPGAPFVSVNAKCVNGETIGTLSQRRFYASAKLMQQPSDQLWQVPVCLSEIGGAGKGTCELMTQKEADFKVSGCGAGLMPNVNGAGFYRYSVDPSLFASEGFVAKSLSEEDQVSLVGDEGALLSGGQHHIQELMALASKFRGVETFGALEELSAQVQFARQYLVSSEDLPQFQAWVRSVFKPALEHLGVSSARTNTPNDLNARAVLIALLGNIGEDPDAIAVAKQAVANYMQSPGAVDATLVDASFPVAAAHGDAALYNSYLAKMKSAGSPQDYYRYFNALADFRDPALLTRTLQRMLTDEVRNQDLRIMLHVLHNAYGKQLAWAFIREHYAELQSKAGQSIFGAQFAYRAVGALCDPKSEQEAKTFLEEHAVPGLERVGRQQVEIVNQCIELRQREEPNLASYLRSNGTAAGQH